MGAASLCDHYSLGEYPLEFNVSGFCIARVGNRGTDLELLVPVCPLGDVHCDIKNRPHWVIRESDVGLVIRGCIYRRGSRVVRRG